MTSNNCIDHLSQAGIRYNDAVALRRIAMTLHSWHELECGDGDNYASWCVTRGRAPKREFYRDPETQAPKWRTVGEFEHDDNGKPYIERHVHTESRARYESIPDRETGALKRLATIMANYPDLSTYVQGDPRGASLYVLRPGDIPAGAGVDSYYSRGIAVYK